MFVKMPPFVYLTHKFMTVLNISVLQILEKLIF
jgi:hypothetical protein